MQIKVIQVGIGRMGKVWLDTVMASEEVGFAGFVEIDNQTIEKRVKEYGLNREIIFNSLLEALMEVKADGVINVTPPQVHEEISLISLEAGIPVLSEKPLADTIESARRIVERSNETGILHMVAQDYRYTVPMQTLKKVLTEGKLGRPGAVYINLFENASLSESDREYVTKYWNKLPYPALMDSSIHHYDLIRFLFESEPVSIFGKSWNPPWSWLNKDVSFSVIMELRNGIKVSYNASCHSTGKRTGWIGDWQIECERGSILVQNGEVWLYPAGKEAMKAEGAKLASTGQAYLLHEFYQALTKQIPPATTCQDNIKSMNMVFDTIESFQKGDY